MNDEISGLKNAWKNARKAIKTQKTNVNELVIKAKSKKSNTVKMHLLNILVLTLTLAGISAFFVYVAKFSQLISLIGMGLMIGGLGLRIAIELVSLYISAKIDLSENTLKTNGAFLRFYSFRKKIHGPVTLTILFLYSVGFYLLTPEFSDYFSFVAMVLIDLSYIFAAAMFTWNIRKAIRKEMGYLNEIKRIQEAITSVS